MLVTPLAGSTTATRAQRLHHAQEYETKTAYLHNLENFTEWSKPLAPANTQPQQTQTITIGVVGKSNIMVSATARFLQR